MIRRITSAFLAPLRGLTAVGIKCERKHSCGLTLLVIVQAQDRLASDIETYEFVSASLGSCVIPLTGLDCCGYPMREQAPAQSNLARHSSSRLDLFASDIKTCKHVSASLGSCIILAFPPFFLPTVLSIV